MIHKTTSPLNPNTHNTTQNIWVTIIFHGPLIRKLSHLLPKTNLKTKFRSTNTFRNILRTRNNNRVSKHKGGIYQVEWWTCKLSYIGQMHCNLDLLYRKQIPTFPLIAHTSIKTQVHNHGDNCFTFQLKRICMCIYIYRVSQEERAILREGVP